MALRELTPKIDPRATPRKGDSIGSSIIVMMMMVVMVVVRTPALPPAIVIVVVMMMSPASPVIVVILRIVIWVAVILNGLPLGIGGWLCGSSLSEKPACVRYGLQKLGV